MESFATGHSGDGTTIHQRHIGLYLCFLVRTEDPTEPTMATWRFFVYEIQTKAMIMPLTFDDNISVRGSRAHYLLPDILLGMIS